MAKIVEFKKKIKKFFGKKDNEEGGEEIGNYSMNEGETDKVFGIKRNLVTGIGGFFGLVFVIAVLFNVLDDGDEVAKVAEPKQLADNEIANADRAKNNLPDSYESFVAMRQEKDKAQQPQQVPQQQQTKVETKPVEVKTQTTPVIPKSSYPEIILPQQTQTVPQVTIPKIETQEVESC